MVEGNGGPLGRAAGLGLWWPGPAGVEGKDLTVCVVVFHFLVCAHLRDLVLVVVSLELVATVVVVVVVVVDAAVVDSVDIVFAAVVVDAVDIVFVAVVVVPLEPVAVTDVIFAAVDVVADVVVDFAAAVGTVVVVVDTVLVVVILHPHKIHATLQKAGLCPLMHSPCLERQQTAGPNRDAEQGGR